MTKDTALVDVRNEVLRKIGRNLVNFQKMEGMLKFLNIQQVVSGSLSDISKVVARAKRAASKQPMGRLADAFIQSVYSAGDDVVRADPPNEVSVTFSLRIDGEPALAAERKRALRAVVKERNKLVHKWLASFDPNSLESCEALVADLDKQHAKTWPEFETLKAIVLAVREHQHEFAQFVGSDAPQVDRGSL